MTKEEKVLWATWMASTDIWEYAVDIVLDFTQMDDFELDRIWENGLHLTGPLGGECVAYPIKSYDVPEMLFLTPGRGTLIRANWGITEEMVVAELKRIGFVAPWVSGMEVKNILVAKWGKNWKEG